MKHYDTVDAWLDDRQTWRPELEVLREVSLAAGLDETIKWGQPCYTDRSRNIVILGGRKHSAIVSFFKGALLDDPRGRLVQPGQERSGRYLPYATVEAIREERPYLEQLIAQAIEVERAGLRVEPLPDDIEPVEELAERLAADDAFREAFEALTPGRQRQYNHHFGGAKKSASRVARIDRCTERILVGKGLLDCICGKSQRYPRCDGSHRELA